MIVLHPHVDLDAVVCAILSGEQEIKFLPAGAAALPTELAGARVLDHPLGDKGRLDTNGTRHAAACVMPEAETAHQGMLLEIDEQDSTGMVRNPRFSLAELLAAARHTLHERGLRDEELDLALIETMRPFIEGLNLIHRKRKNAERLAKGARIETVGHYRVAVFSGEQPAEVGIICNQQYNCSMQVYANDFNLGVFRYPGRQSPDLKRLADRLPGWFIHTAGFLACWGSKKSPATAAPPSGTPQNVDELLEVMRQTFREPIKQIVT